MILYLDTEFTAFGPDAELLSLALVSEDGLREFYAERNDVPESRCSKFVCDTVLPLFGRHPGMIYDFTGLRRHLRLFVEALPADVAIGCDLAKDFTLLEHAFGEPWPWNLQRARIQLETYIGHPTCVQVQEEYYAGSHDRHHALVDARALRAAYLALIGVSPKYAGVFKDRAFRGP